MDAPFRRRHRRPHLLALASGLVGLTLATTPVGAVPATGTPPPGGAAAPSGTDLGRADAQWLDRRTVAWRWAAGPGTTVTLLSAPAGGLSTRDGRLTVPPATIQLPLAPLSGGLPAPLRARFPHLASYPAFTLARRDLGRVADALRGQVIVAARAADGTLLAATSVQLPGALDDVYAAATRAQLGPAFHSGRPSLAVWAPTARTVGLELYDTTAAAPRVLAMRRDRATGVWRIAGTRDWQGKYYRYRVTVWQPAVGRVVTASVTDPYSLALATDSTHSRLVDPADPALEPAGWDRLAKPAAPARHQIQELSVRDFSIGDGTVPAAHRGGYLAFTDTGSAGMTHLRQLAAAGVTDVHLLPVFDFSSVPERRADQASPGCDLAALPPDSDRQQACVSAVADHDGYNWGYDPWHYTVPEGSYATDPDRRIPEFRRMVAGINGAGLRVVLDVVYNHTSAAGVDQHSVLDQIVPGYYQRLLDDGTLATSTCCANTAPEHAMMGKLVVDSVVTWARQYKVDGFRFDLMGHHPKANILAVRAALDALTPARDGVDGKKIILYGEGWNFGEVANNARFVQATQQNMAGTGIGTFNDRLRDAVRGGGPFDADPRAQGFASGLYTDPNGAPVNGSTADQLGRLRHAQDLLKVGLTGNLASYRFVDATGRTVTGAQVDYNGAPTGYTAAPAEAVTYVDAHDNEILYDALAYKLPAATPMIDRVRMQVLALATTVLGQGTGFTTAGSDLLRSKSLDRNSYNSGDWFNQIHWDCRTGNGFGRGLPPAADNVAKWPYARPLLGDAALRPDCAATALAGERFRELQQIRGSSPLFDLATAGQVQDRLSFPLSGPAETPGVVTMLLTDDPAHRLDSRWRSVTVVFNARPDATTQRVPALAGAEVALHPVLAGSADPVLRTARFDPVTGTFTVPARSVAVFVQR